MRLTQRQESTITRYLRDVAAQLEPGLSDHDRDLLLSRIQDRVYRRLGALDKPVVEDADVDAALEALGEPAEWASPASRRGGARRGPAIWLGVCNHLAARLGLRPWVIRLFAVLIGLATGPLALLVYLAGFAELYFTTPRGARPRVNPLRALGLPVVAVIVAVALHLGTGHAIDLILQGYTAYLRPELPPLGQWDWLRPRAGRLLFWVIACVVPLGILAGMPLARRWDHSLKRVMQAILCLYGIACSLGIALIITGLVLDIVRDFTT